MAVGFLHTSEVHVPTFRALLEECDPHLRAVELVDEALLRDAQVRGIDPDLRRRLLERLSGLRDAGATIIVCTCSTLGGAAEQLTEELAIPVVRVDRPMAERAAEIGGRILVVVAVASTLEPTRELLDECIAKSPKSATVIESRCLDAWNLFEKGDVDGYWDRITAHALDVADQADVIVLAQASMAPVAERLAGLPIPVLSSPKTAVDYAAVLAGKNGRRDQNKDHGS